MKPDQPDSPFEPNIPPPASPPQSSFEPSSTAEDKRVGIKEKVRSTKDDLKEQSTAAVQNLKESGRGYAAGKKDKVASRLDRYGEEIDEAARRFEDEDPNIAWLTHCAADRLGAMAERLRQSDFRDLWNDAERVARRHPLAFMGGMFAMGAAIGTFARSSRAEETDVGLREPYGPGGAGSVEDGFSPVEEGFVAAPTGVPTRDY